MKSYLNLGCGSRYHPSWTNIDIASLGHGVIQHDLRCGIPLCDESCAVVYHAALLEHMRYADAVALLIECYRVLKPGGIIRVGVPDLEKACQLYLEKLTAVLNGDEVAVHDYDWLLLELYDQAVREKSGGLMREYLCQNSLPNETFVYQRIGAEGRQLVNALQSEDTHSKGARPSFFSRDTMNLMDKLFRKGLFSRLWKKVQTFPGLARRRISTWILTPEDRSALEIGRFRLSGEAHQWAYDRYSLARLLLSAGFHKPQVQDAKTSQVPDWESFHLDVLPNGQAVKPDLFFMEAIKRENSRHD